MATNFPAVETVYASAELAQAAMPKLTSDLLKPVKTDREFKLGNEGFKVVQNLREARAEATKAEAAKKLAQKRLNELFPEHTKAYGIKGTYRGVTALTVAYGTSQATVDIEALRIAFPEAYAATVTSASQYFYWK